VSIHTTYHANFIETTDMVQQVQQFKHCSSLFQMIKHDNPLAYPSRAFAVIFT